MEEHGEARIYMQPRPAVIGLARSRSLLHVSPSFTIHGADPPPNWWWRFWQWLLLGWKWERI